MELLIERNLSSQYINVNVNVWTCFSSSFLVNVALNIKRAEKVQVVIYVVPYHCHNVHSPQISVVHLIIIYLLTHPGHLTLCINFSLEHVICTQYPNHLDWVFDTFMLVNKWVLCVTCNRQLTTSMWSSASVFASMCNSTRILNSVKLTWKYVCSKYSIYGKCINVLLNKWPH